MTNTSSNFLRPRAAAQKLGIGKATLYRWAASGLIQPPTPLGPRVSGWPESYLDTFIAAKVAGSL